MNLIIRAAKVIDPESSFHDAVVDLQIENGIFTKIAQTLPNTVFQRSQIRQPAHFPRLV
jgi:dihydroorotase